MRKSIEAVVAENITRLMRATSTCGTDAALAERSTLGRGTVQRARKGEVSLTIGNLEALAAAYDLQAWQLLIPDLDPGNPPALTSVNDAERKLWHRLRLAMQELAEYNAGKDGGRNEKTAVDSGGGAGGHDDRRLARRPRRPGAGGQESR